MEKIHVVALGNLLMSDDGVGPYALSVLKKNRWSPQVRFYSPETASLSATAVLRRAGRVLLLDALQGGCQPGTVYRLCARRLQLQTAGALSLHEFHLLHLAARFYPARLREITVLGLEPADISPGTSFSPEVTATLPLLINLATREISGHS